MEFFASSKKKFLLSFCMYKMCQISKKAYEKCDIETIDDKEYFWINRRNLKIESDYKSDFLTSVEKQKYRQELIHNTKFEP